ncbi:hypothetical protein YC2023_100740 [Brassica napus]
MRKVYNIKTFEIPFYSLLPSVNLQMDCFLKDLRFGKRRRKEHRGGSASRVGKSRSDTSQVKLATMERVLPGQELEAANDLAGKSSDKVVEMMRQIWPKSKPSTSWGTSSDSDSTFRRCDLASRRHEQLKSINGQIFIIESFQIQSRYYSPCNSELSVCILCFICNANVLGDLSDYEIT